MTSPSADEILRLARLEKAAAQYRECAMRDGNAGRMIRAANLELAAYNRSMAIVRQVVEDA